MILQHRIDLLVQLGAYMQSNEEAWLQTKERAYRENPWFIPAFVDLSIQHITQQFLISTALQQWCAHYGLPESNDAPKKVGIVMAGNIPLVGFHDFLCAFITGHQLKLKASSKDEVLIKHLVQKMIEWQAEVANRVQFADNLKGCDAYIATGSNNSSRYFEYYFSKYPHIIRKNRTSVAILDGSETPEELGLLADDIQLYFGLGCRNITKLYVPQQYDFIPLLQALKKYDFFADFHKYKHNYDYQLALLIMGNKLYMTNESILLHENAALFSAVSQIHYEYYENATALATALQQNQDVQCIVGHQHIPFGQAQQPTLFQYADGVDTIAFLQSL